LVHLNKVHKNKCTICDETFKSKNDLEEHTFNTHHIEIIESDGEIEDDKKIHSDKEIESDEEIEIESDEEIENQIETTKLKGNYKIQTYKPKTICQFEYKYYDHQKKRSRSSIFGESFNSREELISHLKSEHNSQKITAGQPISEEPLVPDQGNL
jgi:hypothetical protein